MTTLTVAQAAPLLKKEHQDGRLIPFLGAGFSKPLKLPDGSQLIASLAKTLGFEPDLFELHGRFEQLAEYFALSGPGRLQQLVYEMTRSFDSAEAEALRKKSRAHQALAALDWRTVYTTNYDQHAEGALRDAGKPVTVLASFADFQGSRPQGACEVIKFHGTLAQPDTIVLTESSYFQRMALEAPADQRLRSDLLGNTSCAPWCPPGSGRRRSAPPSASAMAASVRCSSRRSRGRSLPIRAARGASIGIPSSFPTEIRAPSRKWPRRPSRRSWSSPLSASSRGRCARSWGCRRYSAAGAGSPAAWSRVKICITT